LSIEFSTPSTPDFEALVFKASADCDGDGKADLAVYHQNMGIWELFFSTQRYQFWQALFGGPEYAPVTE
jgi:hypothetical protein